MRTTKWLGKKMRCPSMNPSRVNGKENYEGKWREKRRDGDLQKKLHVWRQKIHLITQLHHRFYMLRGKWERICTMYSILSRRHRMHQRVCRESRKRRLERARRGLEVKYYRKNEQI